MLIKCHNANIKMKSYTQSNRGTISRSNHTMDYGDAYKYSSHQTQFQTKTGIFIDNYDQDKKIYNGMLKFAYLLRLTFFLLNS